MPARFASGRLGVFSPIHGALSLPKFPSSGWCGSLALWEEQSHVLFLAPCQGPKEIIKKRLTRLLIVSILEHAREVSKKLA
jgi:hypothetical protein